MYQDYKDLLSAFQSQVLSRRCERIGESQKYRRAVILSKAKNLALNSFAISHLHRQSEILRFAQDDGEGLGMTGLGDFFTPSLSTLWSAASR